MKTLQKYVLLILFTCTLISCKPEGQAVNDPEMIAHYINVGQADATLLEFPCGAILIDAGSQDERYSTELINYLEEFFKRRSDLQKTLDLVIVTHCHIDHNSSLKEVMTNFTIKGYIDNGLRISSGEENQIWAQDTVDLLDTEYACYSYETITANGNKNGITNALIDPISCDKVDPKITLLSGRFDTKPEEWPEKEFDNGNNHSIVVRIDFGASSFLFTGDLEDNALGEVVAFYGKEANGMLDTDIYQVGHHGSYNATTQDFLTAMSPEAAVISCGWWSYGLEGDDHFNTYSYGHPRKTLVEGLEFNITSKRDAKMNAKVATAAKKFENYTVTKNVYATPWDNTVQIKADTKGNYTFTRNH